MAGVPADRLTLVSPMTRLMCVEEVATQDMARPEGFRRALATYEIPIEGRDEWLVAAGLNA